MWETNGSQGKGRGKNGKKGEAVQGPLGVRSTGVLQVPRVNSQTRECPPPPASTGLVTKGIRALKTTSVQQIGWRCRRGY